MAGIASTPTPTAADFDVLQNRIAVALAKREQLIKSWTASSSRPRPPPKAQEDIDAEDAEIFNPAPPRLGLGASIPKEFLDGDVKRKDLSSNDTLRQLLMGRNAGFNASKPRSAQEKAGSGRRGLKHESSDEEGRSALGRAKKIKSGNDSSLSEKPLGPNFTTDASKAISAIERKNNAGNNSLPKPATVLQSWTAPKTYAAQPKLSSLSLKRSSASSKLPLVDYSSNEDSDESSKVPSATITKRACDEASKLPASIMPQSTRDVPRKDMEPPAKPPQKSSSGYGSKRSSRSLSSDSEPSDMETAIPLALTSDVVASATIPPAESNQTAAAEAKRVKKHQRRRKNEKEKPKAQAKPATKDGSQKPEVVSEGKTVLPKKIKDRLLDANGN